LKAHNEKRDLHKVPKLDLDFDIAKRAQIIAKNFAVGTKPAVPASEKCGYNVYTADTEVNA
jgi:hypothetical protein